MSEQGNRASSSNVVWHHPPVTRAMREAEYGHRGKVLWFTGLSGSGKSTLAHGVEDALFRRGCRTYVLDGDNVRHGLCGDLGFSRDDRKENIRRISEVARLFVDAGVIVMTAFISPFREDREQARKLIGDDDFLEILCDCPMDVCESRDVKGLYRKARAGLISDFTGVSSPYELPERPELAVPTAVLSLEQSIAMVIGLIDNVMVVNSRK